MTPSPNIYESPAIVNRALYKMGIPGSFGHFDWHFYELVQLNSCFFLALVNNTISAVLVGQVVRINETCNALGEAQRCESVCFQDLKSCLDNCVNRKRFSRNFLTFLYDHFTSLALIGDEKLHQHQKCKK